MDLQPGLGSNCRSLMTTTLTGQHKGFLLPTASKSLIMIVVQCEGHPIDLDPEEVVGMLFLPGEEGQGLVEFALILLLVAIVVLVILAILGPTIGNVVSNIIEDL